MDYCWNTSRRGFYTSWNVVVGAYNLAWFGSNKLLELLNNRLKSWPTYLRLGALAKKNGI